MGIFNYCIKTFIEKKQKLQKNIECFRSQDLLKHFDRGFKTTWVLNPLVCNLMIVLIY